MYSKWTCTITAMVWTEYSGFCNSCISKKKQKQKLHDLKINDNTSVTALIVKNLNTQHIRFLVILQHSVGVEGGRIIHLLHIRTRLLTLRDEKFIRKHLSRCQRDRSTVRSKVTETNIWHLFISRFVFIWVKGRKTDTVEGKSSLLTVTYTEQIQLQGFFQVERLWS